MSGKLLQMEGHESSRVGEAFTVRDERQAALLSDPKARVFIGPFLGCECSVKVASEQLGRTLEATYYRVRTFVDAGLLRVARTEKRAGRPIKLYSATAAVSFVPFRATPYAVLEENIAAQLGSRLPSIIEGLATALHSEEDYGQYVYRGSDGDVWYTNDAPSGTVARSTQRVAPPALDVTGDLSLTSDAAAAFREELRALLMRYQHAQLREHHSARRFAYALLFAPLHSEHAL